MIHVLSMGILCPDSQRCGSDHQLPPRRASPPPHVFLVRGWICFSVHTNQSTSHSNAAPGAKTALDRTDSWCTFPLLSSSCLPGISGNTNASICHDPFHLSAGEALLLQPSACCVIIVTAPFGLQSLELSFD